MPRHQTMRFIPPGSSYSSIFVPSGPAAVGAAQMEWELCSGAHPALHLHSWAPVLHTHQDHPWAPDRQLAPSPVYSSTGKTTTLPKKPTKKPAVAVARAEGVVGAPRGHRVCPQPGWAQGSLWSGRKGRCWGRSLFTWCHQGTWPVHPFSSWAGNLTG